MRIKKEKIILGGGVSGLIWAFYKGGTIVTDKVGGQMVSEFPLGPRFLDATPFTERFLTDLGIPLDRKEIRVGYLIDGEEVESFSRIIKHKYFEKSRGKKFDGDPTSLNGSRSSFQTFEVNFEEVVSKLEEVLNNRILIGKIKRIDLGENLIEVERDFGVLTILYNDLVSSIPFDLFQKLRGIEDPLLERKDMTYVLTKGKKNKFDFVYVPDEEFAEHRRSYCEKGCVCDWLGEHSEEECKRVFGEKYIASKVLKGAQIVSKANLPENKRVRFIGRYGAWNREWKTNKVVEEVLKDGQ